MTIQALKQRNVAVDFGTMSLRNTLGNPYNVSIFLLLELDVCVENSKVKLIHECILHQLNLRT